VKKAAEPSIGRLSESCIVLPCPAAGELRREGAVQEQSIMTPANVPSVPAKQLLHLVFGGELKSLGDVEFANLAELQIVGIYPSYAEAYKAWKAAAQRTVDNAHMRFFIVHIHRLLDPELGSAARS
jgi:hypothetical protein